MQDMHERMKMKKKIKWEAFTNFIIKALHTKCSLSSDEWNRLATKLKYEFYGILLHFWDLLDFWLCNFLFVKIKIEIFLVTWLMHNIRLPCLFHKHKLFKLSKMKSGVRFECWFRTLFKEFSEIRYHGNSWEFSTFSETSKLPFFYWKLSTKA